MGSFSGWCFSWRRRLRGVAGCRGRVIRERVEAGWSCALRGERVSLVIAIVRLSLRRRSVRGAFGVQAAARPGYGLLRSLVVVAELSSILEPFLILGQ